MRTPSLPGENDVTDGSVDYYDTDWENVDNSALEEEMQKCGLTPCEGKTLCPDNTPAQTDLSASRSQLCRGWGWLLPVDTPKWEMLKRK